MPKLISLYRQIPTLSIILLTHATVARIGAFAHCCKHFPLFTKIPIYATQPVINLGRTLLQDLYSSTPVASTIIPKDALSEASYSFSQSIAGTQDPNILLQPPTNEEIATYFKLINPLKYSQQHQPLPSPFSPPLNGLTITAYNAGHTLGGTIWHIQHGLESVVYAVEWNQARENVLSGAAWLGTSGAGSGEVIEQLRKPTALICSSTGSERVALSGGKAKRDQLLLDMIKSAVNSGGIVLIPTDSSARVLELAYLLEHAWRADDQGESPFGTSKLYLASKNIGATMSLTRSMLEWTNDAIVKELETAGEAKDQTNGQTGKGRSVGPFDFKHLRLLQRRGQIDKIMEETDNLGRSFGKVILASDTSIDWGFSNDVLRKIAEDSRNLVILTEKMTGSNTAGGPVAKTLWSYYEERRDGVAPEQTATGEKLEQVYGGGRELIVKEASRTPLEGDDLDIYQQYLANQRQLYTTLQSGMANSMESSADVVDDASSESSSESEDSDSEQQGKALNISATMGHANRKKVGLTEEDLGINILLRKKGVHDFDVRGKKGRERMFPLAVRRKRDDDFGELIRPEDFLRAEERDEADGQDLRQPGKFDTKDTLGKKRKWDDIATSDRRSGKRVNGDGRLTSEPGDDSFTDEYSVADEPEEEVFGPSRLVMKTSTLKINLRLAFVDFAGVHDKRSLQMLIPLIQPRKLILVSGTKDETLILADDCRKLLAVRSASSEGSAIDVYTPEVGISVDASVDTNAWIVKLTDAFVKRLRWQNVKGLGIVTITGRLNPSSDINVPQDEGSNKKRKLLKGEEADDNEEANASNALALISQAGPPVLDVLPSNMASATRSVAQPLHVGDLRLADLRKIMQSSGHTAEFRGEGILLIDGSVIVRKSGTSTIELEGAGYAASTLQDRSTFYAVRNKIYAGLAVVAGG